MKCWWHHDIVIHSQTPTQFSSLISPLVSANVYGKQSYVIEYN